MVQRLGAGGMGTVYEAFDNTLNRRVAVKILRRHLAAANADRLIREAQALARLSHSNVVQVYEVGEFEGRTFIVMERISGQTLTQWCKQAPRPGWRECVEVYLQAGAGLAAAHEQGLVHRDFKPSNVMIDERGRVCVLDFGLARTASEFSATGLDKPDLEGGVSSAGSSGSSSLKIDTPLTETGCVIGTPAYMSLEQILGEPVDAQSDQFSFCVSLWEAVYGQRPFQGASLDILAEQIGSGNIVSAHNAAAPVALRNVLLRGLAPNPGDRWSSMDMLLGQLRRLVVPRGRRRAMVVVGAGLTVIVGALGVQTFIDHLERCSGAAQQLEGVWDQPHRQRVGDAILGTQVVYASDTAAHILPQLDAFAEAWSSKYTEACEATVVRHEQSEEHRSLRMHCLHERLTTLDATVKILAQANAQVVENAVDLVGALPTLARCDDLEWLERRDQRIPPPEDGAVAEQVDSLRGQLEGIKAEQWAGNYDGALEQIEPVAQRADTLDYGPLRAEVMQVRGSVKVDSGRYEEAEQDLREAHRLALELDHTRIEFEATRSLTAVVGQKLQRPEKGWQWGQMALALAKRMQERRYIAASLNHLGIMLDVQGKYEEAEAMHRRALSIMETMLRSDHPDIASVLNNLGSALENQGKYEEAESNHRRVLSVMEAALGPEHPRVAVSLTNLSNVLRAQGKYEQSEAVSRRALSIMEAALGPEHPDVASGLNNLSNVLREQGKYEQSELMYRRALTIREATLRPDHPDTASSMSNLGIVLNDQGKYEESEVMYRRALSIWETALGPEHPVVGITLHNLGIALDNQGKYEQSEDMFRRAVSIREVALGPEHPGVGQSLNSLGNVLRNQGKYEEGEAMHRRALAVSEAALDPEHPLIASVLNNLGNALSEQGKYEQGEATHRRALAIWEAALGPEHPDIALSLNNLGDMLAGQGRYEESRAMYQRALSMREALLGPEHPNVAESRLGLAIAALELHDTKSAREHAERAVSIYEATAVQPYVVALARFVLARALWSRGAERQRARQLAELAADAFATAGVGSQDDLAEVEVWLAEHRVR